MLYSEKKNIYAKYNIIAKLQGNLRFRNAQGSSEKIFHKINKELNKFVIPINIQLVVSINLNRITPMK